MAKDSKGIKIGKGILGALVPMRAYRSLVETKDSLSRIGRMFRGAPLAAPGEQTATPEEQTLSELEREGKEIVGSMDPVARFNLFYVQMEWNEKELLRQMRAIRRGHNIRLCALGVALLLLPSLVIKYGWLSWLYDLSLIAYLFARCIKSACMYTQLEERSLVEFKDLRARPDHWLLKRSLWFLD